MSANQDEALAALQTLDRLAAAVEFPREGDADALDAVVSEANLALARLRKFHVELGKPVKQSALNGNGH